MVVLHLLFPVVEIFPHTWQLLGSLPLLFGILLNLVADKAFKRNHTTVKPLEESTSLITTGVFRLSRHPMYLGMVLVLIGIAMLLGSLTPLMVVPVFVLLMDVKFIRAEERMLARKFGDTWHDYRTSVRRWL